MSCQKDRSKKAVSRKDIFVVYFYWVRGETTVAMVMAGLLLFSMLAHAALAFADGGSFVETGAALVGLKPVIDTYQVCSSGTGKRQKGRRLPPHALSEPRARGAGGSPPVASDSFCHVRSEAVAEG